MSQQGYLVWHTDASLDQLNPVKLLSALPELIGFERSDGVYRDDLDDFLAENVLATEIHRLYVPGTKLLVEADFAKLGQRVKSAITRSIPEEVRGEFLPSQSFFEIGKGTFVDAVSPAKEVQYTVLIGCWSSSTPPEHDAMCSSIAKLPDLHREKIRLEHLIGDLQQSLYFSF